MSNRKRPQFIEKVDAASHASFYETYSTDIHSDTTLNSPVRYENIRHFDFESLSGLNIGPVIFYGNDQKMAFVASANEAGADGARTLQLYFSEKKGGKWSIPLPYKYNSLQYSISSPAISNDGKVLYFSSDMKGGLGGKDLYTSAFYHGEWSVPVNLGASVNTARDEEFPYLHQSKTLYFSSNGHAGIGGLDIFYTAILDSGFSEPENMGYPMNSSYDDFGIMLDSSGTRGYFSSNRKNGGYDDDVYKFKMDLQSYPVTIKGILKYKESRLNELSEARILAKAKIFLIDNDRHSTVYEGSSDDQGNFSVVVPYFSTYIVRVVGDDGREEDVVLEIPKFTSQLSDHEIVIIKNIF